MNRKVCPLLATALVVVLAAPAFAGGPSATAQQLANAAQGSPFGFTSVGNDASFGNIWTEYDRAFSAVDLHGVQGSQWNRNLGGLVNGFDGLIGDGDRPTTLFTGLSNNSQQDLFQLGVTGGAGDKGAYSVGILYDDESDDNFSSTFGDNFNSDEDTVTQIDLNYGRMVKDNIWVAGGLTFGEIDSNSFNQSGTGIISTDTFLNESSFTNLDVSAKILGDSHALAFGINYGMAEFDNTSTFIDDNAGAIDSSFNGFMVERDGFGGFIRYTAEVRDNLQYEIAGGFDMHEADLDDSIVSQFIPSAGTPINDQIASNDEVTIDAYNVRGTLLHRPAEKVDMYYTAWISTGDVESTLDLTPRTDGTPGTTTAEAYETESTVFAFDLAARYWLSKKTAITFGARWLNFDSEDMTMFDGTLISTDSDQDSDTSFRAALSHLLNDRFRFDIGFYEDSFGGFGPGGVGVGGGGSFGNGDFVNLDQFRASVTASF